MVDPFTGCECLIAWCGTTYTVVVGYRDHYRLIRRVTAAAAAVIELHEFVVEARSRRHVPSTNRHTFPNDHIHDSRHERIRLRIVNTKK